MYALGLLLGIVLLTPYYLVRRLFR